MSGAFVQTDTVLDRILARKIEEIAERQRQVSLVEMRRRAERGPYPARNLLAALRGAYVSLIAEVKRASPSKGLLTKDFAPVLLAATYAQNGAAAISVLTDEDFFSRLFAISDSDTPGGRRAYPAQGLHHRAVSSLRRSRRRR